jgi:hypothetical protein
LIGFIAIIICAAAVSDTIRGRLHFSAQQPDIEGWGKHPENERHRKHQDRKAPQDPPERNERFLWLFLGSRRAARRCGVPSGVRSITAHRASPFVISPFFYARFALTAHEAMVNAL